MQAVGEEAEYKTDLSLFLSLSNYFSLGQALIYIYLYLYVRPGFGWKTGSLVGGGEVLFRSNLLQ